MIWWVLSGSWWLRRIRWREWKERRQKRRQKRGKGSASFTPSWWRSEGGSKPGKSCSGFVWQLRTSSQQRGFLGYSKLFNNILNSLCFALGRIQSPRFPETALTVQWGFTRWYLIMKLKWKLSASIKAEPRNLISLSSGEKNFFIFQFSSAQTNRLFCRNKPVILLMRRLTLAAASFWEATIKERYNQHHTIRGLFYLSLNQYNCLCRVSIPICTSDPNPTVTSVTVLPHLRCYIRQTSLYWHFSKLHDIVDFIPIQRLVTTSQFKDIPNTFVCARLSACSHSRSSSYYPSLRPL